MDTRVLVFLFIICICWCCKARDLPLSHVSQESGMILGVESTSELSKGDVRVGNDQLCLACENLASEALNYLLQNKTEKQILSLFHRYCSIIPSFERQCLLLVDFYGPLFFANVETLQPGEFCRKFGLCEGAISISKDKCEICHDVVTEALLKLKDPDTELEIVEVLLKACSSIGKNVAKCKKLVLEYAPLILINAEEFLETKDICGILRACKSTTVDHNPSLLAES